MTVIRTLLFSATIISLVVAPPPFQDQPNVLVITHGPILGRITDSSVGIWARTSRPGEFRIVFGTDPNALDLVSDAATTLLKNDQTGVVNLSGLLPDTKYFYQLVIGVGDERKIFRGGSFKTLPSSRQYVDAELNPRGLFNFRFEFACGNNQNVPHSSGPELPAFKTMLSQLKDNIDFAILNGDWLYEAERDYSLEQWRESVGIEPDDIPPQLQLTPTMVGVWQNYKHFLNRGANLRAWHRHIPSFFTFDDHEILNDVWGAGSPGLRDRRAVFRDIGVQAWYDYLGWSNPVAFTQGISFGRARLQTDSDILVDESADFTAIDLKQASNLHVHWGGPTAGVNELELDGVGGDPNAGVYKIVKVIDKNRIQIEPAARADGTQTYSIGRRSYYKFSVSNCDFFVLDTRSHRQMHDTSEPDKPGLSMLGTVQMEWLQKEMTASRADFMFVVSSVNFMVPHVGGGAVRTSNKDDAWTVFFDEREKLIKFWDSLDKRVLVLTGDLHNSFVIKITDRVWEFASGPHNSNNHWASDEGDRPATGSFKYGPRECDIRWSTYFRTDIPRDSLVYPTYCVVQINNVFNNPKQLGDERWVAFERPQVIFQYHDGRTGELRYAESIPAVR